MHLQFPSCPLLYLFICLFLHRRDSNPRPCATLTTWPSLSAVANAIENSVKYVAIAYDDRFREIVPDRDVLTEFTLSRWNYSCVKRAILLYHITFLFALYRFCIALSKTASEGIGSSGGARRRRSSLQS